MPNIEHKPTERVLNILELLSTAPEGLTLSDIAKSIGAPKTTLLPVLHTMAHRNFISCSKDSGLYTTGIAAYLAGSSYSGGKSVMEFIKNEMSYAVDQTNEICQLGIRSGNRVLYIAKIDSNEAIRLISNVGRRLPLHATALGKALLYNFPLEQLDSLYPQGLQKMTDHTITSMEVLKAELLEVNREKFAHEKQESAANICCYAVPICCSQKTIASLSISIPAFRDTPEKAALIRNVLTKIGSTIEQYLADNHLDENTFCAYDSL